MGELVRLEVEDAVGTIRLDRPKMNAINAQLRAELHEAALEARDREDVRAVVLYGGERIFAAGADIAEMSSLTYAEMLAWASPRSCSGSSPAVAAPSAWPGWSGRPRPRT